MRAIRSGDLADRAFARLADNVPDRDRAWLHELVYGTLRLRGRLDYILSAFVKKGLASLDDDVLDILRLATYQLIAMDSVPAYAAVSQAVDMTRAARKKSATGFVNGVLKNVGRSRPQPPAGSATDVLSTWGSHPRWLVERWLAQFGAEATEKLVELNNRKPAIYIRRLDADEHELVDGAVTDALAVAPAIVQDPAAGLVARYVGARHGVIADLCAAPGGKTIAIANDLDEGIVIASDISRNRLSRVIENVERTRLSNVRFAVADARYPVVKDADTVLIDAPCSGTGTFRRHPDGKWRIALDDVHALTALQRDILDAASAIVKVGGTLVYATCSLEPEENQQQMSAFLERHPNFKRSADELMVLPHETGYDGAFAARMERVA
jgi:16S rRNA (cytosine967-C5)-methyltransferase